jgi:hypothetical protein
MFTLPLDDQAYMSDHILMDKKPVKQPQWALESTNSIVRSLVKMNILVSRSSYIDFNYLGEYDPKQSLPAELEMSLPEPLRLYDEDGRERADS